ncbi:EAL domain-containing protein [Glaciimonas sp. PAMC28666]|nr:EAL domain-containing protein [Glaciimonas sp. PAMC28666]
MSGIGAYSMKQLSELAELVIANKELAFQNGEKEKRAAELVVANKELAFQNGEKGKRAAELAVANTELAFQNAEKEKRAAELAIANTELAFQNEEKEKRAAELAIANTELAFQNEEKEKRVAELVIANKELAFQNEEKEKRAAELAIANTELAFQNEEKEKRAAELAIANRELAFQNEEKEKRAAELAIANTELAFQNEEKEKRAAELAIANTELAFQNQEKEKRAAELVIANTELAFQNGEKEKRVAELVIANIELAFQNEEKGILATELNNLAFYDTLTGLPNRRLLLDRLQHAFASSERSGRDGVLMFIDLDKFKDLNDTLGHDFGDLLLQQTAQRLASCTRENDTVARLGGDEFVIMLGDLSEQPIEAAIQAKAVGDKILAALNRPYLLALHEYHSTASIGAALFKDHGKSAEELLKRADIAMYQAKKAGRNTLRFFNPKMQEVINARISLEGDLRKALESPQFQLYYQVQVDSRCRPFGVEALIRWIHPVRGLVCPAQFIPLAEESGLIVPIGQWVLETACSRLKIWQQDALTRDLVLAVNISAVQFHQSDFVAQMQSLVHRHDINPTRLKLEITESLLLKNIENAIATMNALKEIGIHFSLDDFGTGYSSLQYLKRLPISQLKIDQSFINDIATDSSDKAIVCAIIAMAQSLNLDVIAEGVETEEQRQFLLDRSCTHYQGYLFSKPVPVEEFEALLRQRFKTVDA